jgi:hypothetical protein
MPARPLYALTTATSGDFALAVLRLSPLPGDPGDRWALAAAARSAMLISSLSDPEIDAGK